ncbi:MAG: ABC transporter permease [Candidatus Dormibacteria bacterium]
MSWRDGIALALRSVMRRPARTVLTILAVALGSGLLVALVAIAQVADTQVISQLGKGGPASAITVLPAAATGAQLGSDSAQAGRLAPITDSAVNALRRAPAVTSIQTVVSQTVFVVPPPRGGSIPTFAGEDPDRHLPRPFSDNLLGVDLRAANQLPITLLAGRLPAVQSTSEVAVTAGYLDHLHLDAAHPERVLGTVVELGAPQVVDASQGVVRSRWTRAAITGVVAQNAGSGDILASQALVSTDRAWQLDGVDGTSIGLGLPQSPYSGLIVVADSLADVHQVRAEITTLGFANSAPEHLVASTQRYLHVVDIVLGAIGTIALIIAALGIANALLAAVRERRREIGILKAIGARDGDILRWFLTEAFVCGGIGGILGTLFGLAAVSITAQIVDTYLVQQGLGSVALGGVPVATALIGVLGSVLLSLVAAAWPALRAARLPAREAVGAL